MKDTQGKQRGLGFITIIIKLKRSGLGFLSKIAAILSFTVGVGVGMKTSFASGADDRIQDILDDNDCEDGMYVVLKAEGHFNIPGTELKEITYLDVLSAVTPDEIEELAEWV